MLQASNPLTEGALSNAKDQAEKDWAMCAAKVDTIVDYQEKADEKAGVVAAGAEPVN